MSAIYDQIFKVPCWVVIDSKVKNAKELADELKTKGAHLQEWPANSFLDTIQDLGKKGYSHVTGQKRPFTLDPDFCIRSVVAHLRGMFGDQVQFSGQHRVPFYRAVNRVVKTEGDYSRIFDAIVNLEDAVSISQMFQIGEKKSPVYVTLTPCTIDIIRKISDRFVTVGNKDTDVVVKGKELAEMVSLVESAIDSGLKV